MNAKQIDINDYVVAGEGANGLSYNSISDPDIMVKIYNESYDKDAVVEECEVARKVYDLGVPSPEPGELVADGNRLGIRFRRINPKRSYSRVFSQEPDRVEEFSTEFAKYCKQIHSIEVPAGQFTDAKVNFLHFLDTTTELDAQEKEKFRKYIIEDLPTANTALHGDMHFGNVLTTLPQGAPMSDPHKVYFIDLGYFSYGYPLIDLGMTWNICKLADEEFIKHDMHFDRKIALRAWDAFMKEYFFGPEELAKKYFGPDVSEDQIDDLMKKYRLSEALMAIYKLYTDEFSGWYLEMIKPQYMQPIDRATYEVTLQYFDQMLRLLHPFMPFITEELWQDLAEREAGESIMFAQIQLDTKVDEELLSMMEFTKEVVAGVRNVRAMKNIPPKDKMTLISQENVSELVNKLANVEVLVGGDKPAASASFIVGTSEFCVPLDSFINKDDEIKKLEADLAHQEGFLKGVMAKLGNERFVQNAKPEVVELERKKKADAEQRIATLKLAIAALNQ